MLFLPLLLLLSGLCRCVPAADPLNTYQHVDPSTGATLTCDKCPPGKHMAAHCTATTPTECAPCRPGHYTALWNYLPRCIYCSNLCMNNQEVEVECNALSDRVCRCRDGYYLRGEDFCAMHSVCEPGEGVQVRGSHQNDTVCERCSDGSFSSSSSALDPCVNHQTCASGEILLLNGSAFHDTVCGTCQDFANGGESLSNFLSGLFSMHRVRVSKLKRFVSKNIEKSGVVSRQRDLLLDQIRNWLAQNPKEKVPTLPSLLRAAQLNSIADKLEMRLSELELQDTNCRLSH